MLIESRITTLIESMRRLQAMVQSDTLINSSGKLKSQQLLAQCEEAVHSLFNLPLPNVDNRLVDANSSVELTNQITVVAYESNHIFKILDTLPLMHGNKATVLVRRDDNRLVKNNFNNKLGHIRAEFTNDSTVFYIIQYADTSYSCTIQDNVTLV